jgi:hypothetical protein
MTNLQYQEAADGMAKQKEQKLLSNEELSRRLCDRTEDGLLHIYTIRNPDFTPAEVDKL